MCVWGGGKADRLKVGSGCMTHLFCASQGRPRLAAVAFPLNTYAPPPRASSAEPALAMVMAMAMAMAMATRH